MFMTEVDRARLERRGLGRLWMRPHQDMLAPARRWVRASGRGGRCSLRSHSFGSACVAVAGAFPAVHASFGALDELPPDWCDSLALEIGDDRIVHEAEQVIPLFVRHDRVLIF